MSAADFRERLMRLLQKRFPLERDRYAAGLLAICILAELMGGWTSTDALVRNSCFAIAVALVVLLLGFSRGVPAAVVTHLGTLLGLVQPCFVAWIEGGIYSPALVWVMVYPITQFYVVGRRAGIVWLVLVLLACVLQAYFSLTSEVSWTFFYDERQAISSLPDYVLAAIAALLVPLIYKRLHDRALNDIQSRHRELQTKQEELEHTLQMREHFIASVSHELRTPMNAILGLNSVLLERVGDKPQARKVLEYTRQSADHLMTVINDVLDYSQFSSGKLKANPEVFELGRTVQAAFELFKPRIESTKLHYECRIAPDVPRQVKTDRHRLTQVLVNLLGNAVKFTHQGEVLLLVQAREGGVVFEVQDTGIGIAADQQSRIFERFGQADRTIQSEYGGSGLGLTISQQLVQMLGGHMGLHSEPGKGSRFWFWLPLQEVHEPLPQTPTAQPSAPQGERTLRFLVVDDHPVNRLLVRQALQRQWPGSEVQECENGVEVVQTLGAGQHYDLVLMDMVMPEMDGIEATQWIRANADERIRTMPILGLTANVSAQDLVRFERAGLDGLLLKPFELERLRAEVLRLVQSAAPAAWQQPTG